MSDLAQDKSEDIESGGVSPAGKTLATCFLLLMSGVALSTFMDWRSLEKLEQTVEGTAVGDTEYQIIGERRINHETVEVTFEGVPLYFAYLKEVKVDDTQMRAIGRDDADRYTIYEPEIEKLKTGSQGQKLYYIKRKPDKYAQLHDRPEEMLPPVLR